MDPQDLDEQAKITESERQESVRREMERQSLDTCAIFNPFDSGAGMNPRNFSPEGDYFIIYNNYLAEKVPNKNKDIGYGLGVLQCARYLAEKYVREMRQHILNAKSKEGAKALIEQMQKTLPKPLTVHEKQEYVERTSRYTDIEYQRKITDILFLGVVRKFGFRDDPVRPRIADMPDTRDIDERLFKEVSKKKYVPPEMVHNDTVVPTDDTEDTLGKLDSMAKDAEQDSFPITKFRGKKKDVTAGVAQP